MSAPKFPEAMPPVDLTKTLQPLSFWASNPSAEADLESIFGPRLDWVTAFKHIDAFYRADFSFLPAIHTLPAADMPGLWGGYSRDTREIYLSADCPRENLSAVLIEEIGHFLDQELCSEETLGEEGARFAALVLGLPLEAASDDDSLAPLFLQGREILVEAARKSNKSGGRSGRGKKKSQFTYGGGGAGGTPQSSPSNVPSSSSGSSRLSGSVILPPNQSGNNRIEQRRVGDTLVGSAGNDTYVIFDQNVTINDSYGGTDLVESKVTFSLAKLSPIENLSLTGASNIDGTGNARSNIISGNSGNNKLDGGIDSVSDTLQGGSGNDTYALRDTLDVVLEAVASGTDTIETTVATFSLENYANVENLAYSGTGTGVTFTGNTGNNSLTGTSGADSLDGGAGADTLAGGLGNDTYSVDNSGDLIIENASSGKDLLISTAAAYVLGGNVENLTLAGTGAISGTGNSLANILGGNIAANFLAGASGSDSIFAAAGDDILSGGDDNDLLVGDASALIEDSAGEQIKVTAFDDTKADSNANALAQAALKKSSNISITSAKYTGAQKAVGFLKEGVNFGSIRGDEVKLGSGIVLSTGLADTSKKTADFNASTSNSTAGSYLVNDILKDIFNPNVQSRDAATLEFSFTVSDPNAKWISMDILFGSEEYPEFINSFPDIAGVFIDGQNAAFFTGDSKYPLSVLKKNVDSGYFLDNSSAEYSTVYDGITAPLTLAGSLGGGVNGEHSIKIVIADTNDRNLDSAIFVSNIQAVQSGLFGIRSIQEFGNDSLLGGTGNDTLLGNGGNDTLLGEEGDDRLNGGVGADSMLGGDGDDIYVVDNAGDTVVELADEGTDVIEAVSSYTLTSGSSLEVLRLTGLSNTSGSGNALANSLFGNAGNNVLNGLGGNDTLDGGAGDDTLLGGDGEDVFICDSVDGLIDGGTGNDEVQSPVSITLAGGRYTSIENFRLTGSSNLNAAGDSLANIIYGNAGNNSLDGAGGQDTLIAGDGNDTLNGGKSDEVSDSLIGGKGDDLYILDSTLDSIFDEEGNDTVFATFSVNLSSTLGAGIDNITLSNDLSAANLNINATGNSLANIIIGNSGNNALDGLGGSDFLQGGAGNDTLNGGAGDNAIDTLNGGAGNNLYLVDVSNLEFSNSPTAIDFILSSGGNDTVQSSSSYDLAAGNISDPLLKTLIYIGTTASTLRGNASDNLILSQSTKDDILEGRAGNDTLNGGGGADAMSGGLGDDVYVVDNGGDSIFEDLAGGFADRAQSSVSYTLASNVEVLELTGREFIHGTGNATDNSLFGNVGNNSLFGLGGNDTLDGGSGSDTLDGGIGDDYYIVESDTDKIIDLSGNDTLETAFNNIDLDSKSDFRVLEGLVLSGLANVATGNSLNNIITSKDRFATASRKFYGALGDDTLYGGVGADLLYGEDGNDTILGGTNTTTGEADSDSAANTLSGGVGNDFLEGGGGGDLLLGGTNGYAGFSDRDAESSSNRDTLLGGDGNDTLDGGLGLDSMVGGQGDDFYYAESSDDVFFEAKDQGIDTVFSEASLDLSDFGTIENAILTGSADNNLIASDINNFIKGNVGRNSLSGLGGDDTIDGGDGTDTLDGGAGFDLVDGGAGSDYMLGGLGNDTFVVDNAEDRIIESDVVDSGRDEVRTSINFDPISPWLVEFGFDPAADDGSPSITKQKSFAYLDRDKFQNLENFTFTGPAARGIGNALDNSFSGNALDNIVLAQGGNDTLIGNAGNDSLYGESDGLYATAADSYSSNPQPPPTGFSALIKYLEDEITGGFLGVGADYIDGGEGNDYIDGGALNDTMIGGVGNDTIVIDNEEDILNEAFDAGIDWVISSINVYALAENFENLHLNVQQPSPWQGENAGGADPGQPAQTAPARVAVGNSVNNLITVSYAKDDPITIEDESITQFPQQTVASISEVIANNSTQSISWQIPAEPNANTVPLTNFVAQFRRSGTSQWITQKWDIRPVDSSYTFSSLETDVQYDFRVQALGVTTLEGRDGDDSLIGADFRESLLGGAGNDYLDGAVGDDMLAGGFGNDTLVVDSLTDAMLEFGLEGRDMVVSSITLDLSDNIVETGKFMEDMKAADPAGDINLSGNRLDNSLFGNDYDNKLFGEIGNDSLIGGNGYDWLSGDDGNDWLLGSFLTATKEFTQIDTLTGGAGADTFALNSLFDGDTDTLRYRVSNQDDYALILDFEIGVDKLNLGSGSFGFGNLPAGITTGQALYYLPPFPLAPNLIAVIQTTTGNPANFADF